MACGRLVARVSFGFQVLVASLGLFILEASCCYVDQIRICFFALHVLLKIAFALCYVGGKIKAFGCDPKLEIPALVSLGVQLLRSLLDMLARKHAHPAIQPTIGPDD